MNITKITNPASLTKYIKGFVEFEKYLNKIHSNLGEKFKEDKGYLINIKYINEIKRKINYEKNKEKYIENLSNPFYEDSKKYFTVEEIKFRNSNYLLNMIFNENEYIMINTNLWELLCKENKEKTTPITYKYNYLQMKFKLKDEKELIFSNYNNHNIIDIVKFYSNPEYDSYKKKFDSFVDNTFNKIQEYYEYQKKFENYLDYSMNNEVLSGYLVDIDWFKKWESFHDYLNIKSNYIEKNKDEKEAINSIIYHQQLNKIKNISLDEPFIPKISNKNELISYLKSKKLIMVNTSLIISSEKDLPNKIIYYYLKNKKIGFCLGGQEKLEFETKDNIITMKTEDSLKFPNLMQLAKIFCFRKLLSKKIYKNHEIINNNNPIILIKKVIIHQYLTYFNYTKLSNYLENLNLEGNNDLEQKYDSLVQILKAKANDYYKELKIKENQKLPFNFKGENFILKPQHFNYQGKELRYLSDFEILDIDIFSFFKVRKILLDSQVIKGEYMTEDEKIFLSYEYMGKNYYQIGTFYNSNKDFVLEYIIDDSNTTKKQLIDNFSLFGINELLKYLSHNKISTEYKTICYCYEYKQIGDWTNDDITMKDAQYNIEDVFSFLMTLNVFENNIIRKMTLSKSFINDLENVKSNPFSTISCKLINGNFIKNIKELFNYQQIQNIVKKYQINFKEEVNYSDMQRILEKEQMYKNFLLGKKNDFLKLKKNAVDFLKIEKKSNEEGSKKFQYPMMFNIIDNNLFDKIINFLDLKEIIDSNNSIKKEDILLTFNTGYIVFKGLEEDFLDNNQPLLYLYSSNIQNEIYSINYNPEAIINCITPQNFNNEFTKIMKLNIMDNLINSQKYFETLYNCKILLIFNKNEIPTDTEEINDSYLSNNNMDQYWNKLLSDSFLFCKEYMDFYELINIFHRLDEKNLKT